MAEPREPQDDSDRVTEGQAPGAGRTADSLLGGGGAGISCGCALFTALLAAACVVPFVLMELFAILLTAAGFLEIGVSGIAEAPAYAFGFATVAAPCIAGFALLVAAVVGLVVGQLLHRR